MNESYKEILNYGVLGVCFVAACAIAGKVIIVLFRGYQDTMDKRYQDMIKEKEQLRADFNEMRNLARSQAFKAAEEATTAVLRSNNMMEKIETVLSEMRILLTRFWENKL